MAQSPRRSSRGPRRSSSSGRRGGSRRDGPPAAKPVRPAAAKPVKPAAAQPVRPAAAKPVKPAAAKPARPAQAKAAAPAKPARAASGGTSRRRAAEEEIGGRGGRGRSAPSRGGMGLGAKVGLTAGLLTLLVGALASLLVGSGGGDENAALDDLGFRVARGVSAMDTSLWVVRKKRSTGPTGFERFKRDFQKLVGPEHESKLQDIIDQILDTSDFENLEPEEKTDRVNSANEFRAQKQKLFGDASASATKVDGSPNLNRLLGATPIAEGARVMALWVRKGGQKPDGELLASAGFTEGAAKFDPAPMAGKLFGKSTGTLTQNGETYDVNLYSATGGGNTGGGGPVITAYVAIWNGDTGAGGGSKAPVGLGASVLGAIVVGFLASTIANKHTQGVKNLARDIDRLGTSGDPTRNIRAQGAEATQVARAVERMVSNLEFRDKHEGADLDEVVSREQRIANEIHGALMSKNPPRLEGYEVETLFKPGFEIGGDHFEYFRIDETHLGVILLDTNVRGVPAALVISQAKAYVRAAAPHTLSPAEVLRIVNRNLAGDLPAGRHVTALYAVIDVAEGKAVLASAGHLPLIVYRHSSGKVFKVNPEGIALGLDKGPVFDRSLEEGDIPIGVGDRIVLYTDGALKVSNTEAEEFGETRFYQAVSREAPKNSQAFVNFVGSAIDQFHLDAPQNDDITISTVKRLR